MNVKPHAALIEAIELLTKVKTSCPPPIEKLMDAFIAEPGTLDKAVEFLLQAKGHTGMFNKSYIEEFTSRIEGSYYNEKDFFYERLPGEQ